MTVLDDIKARQPRQMIARKITLVAWVTTLGSIVAIMASFATMFAWAEDKIPFVKNSTFINRETVVDKRLNELTDITNDLMVGQSEIQRNGLLSLELQLRTSISELDDGIGKTARENDRRILMQTRIEMSQRLDEVKRKLTR